MEKVIGSLKMYEEETDPQSMCVLTNQAVEIKKRTFIVLKFLNCQDLYGVVVELVNT